MAAITRVGINAAFVICATIFVAALEAYAFDPAGLNNPTPELIFQGGVTQVRLHIPAAGLQRARVLVARRFGFQTVPMLRNGGELEATLSFEDLAVLSYQFQVQDESKHTFESAFDSVRQPASETYEASIREATEKRDQEAARIELLKQRLHAVQATDPKSLERQRTQDLARALVELGEREREYARLAGEAPMKIFQRALSSWIPVAIVVGVGFAAQASALELRETISATGKADAGWLIVVSTADSKFVKAQVVSENGVLTVAGTLDERTLPADALVGAAVRLDNGEILSNSLHRPGDSTLSADSVSVARDRIESLKKEIDLLQQNNSNLETSIQQAEAELRIKAGFGAVDEVVRKIHELDRKIAEAKAK